MKLQLSDARLIKKRKTYEQQVIIKIIFIAHSPLQYKKVQAFNNRTNNKHVQCRTIQPVATDDPVASCVSLSVCLSVTLCRMAEQVEVLFEVNTLEDRWHIVWGCYPPSRWEQSRENFANCIVRIGTLFLFYAFFAKLLWPLANYLDILFLRLCVKQLIIYRCRWQYRVFCSSTC